MRAAHSLSAHPGIDSVVVIGPATSRSFTVVDTAEGCDFLVGSGPKAPEQALQHGVPLIWDGDGPADGVMVWAANPKGLALALAARETDPQLVAVAHPAFQVGSGGRAIRFPDPVGQVRVVEQTMGGRALAVGTSSNQFAACLTVGAGRRVAIVDDGEFLAGITLAAGVSVAGETQGPVWKGALPYLEACTEMGVIMAESE